MEFVSLGDNKSTFYAFSRSSMQVPYDWGTNANRLDRLVKQVKEELYKV
jgi:hypothetical protein